MERDKVRKGDTLTRPYRFKRKHVRQCRTFQDGGRDAVRWTWGVPNFPFPDLLLVVREIATSIAPENSMQVMDDPSSGRKEEDITLSSTWGRPWERTWLNGGARWICISAGRPKLQGVYVGVNSHQKKHMKIYVRYISTLQSSILALSNK